MRWTVAFPMFPADHLLPMARARRGGRLRHDHRAGLGLLPRAGVGRLPVLGRRRPLLGPRDPVRRPVRRDQRDGRGDRAHPLPHQRREAPDPRPAARREAAVVDGGALATTASASASGSRWIPEEFAWTHTDMRTRGKRADEMIEILRLVCGGGGPQWVEYHGTYYDFDRLMMAPAPEQPVPIYVGGLSEPGLRRAARLGDGWISVQNTEAEITGAIDGAAAATAPSTGGPTTPFEINALLHRRVRPRRVPPARRRRRHRAPGRPLVLLRRRPGRPRSPHRLARPVRRQGHHEVLMARRCHDDATLDPIEPRRQPRGRVTFDETVDVVVVGLGDRGHLRRDHRGRGGRRRCSRVERGRSPPAARRRCRAGLIYLGGGTPVQRACGYEDSAENMERFLLAACGPRTDAAKVHAYCAGLGRALPLARRARRAVQGPVQRRTQPRAVRRLRARLLRRRGLLAVHRHRRPGAAGPPSRSSPTPRAAS